MRHLRTAQELAKSIRIMEAAIFFVEDADVEKGIQHAKNFVVGYMWLAHASFVEATCLFKQRPKNLACAHMWHVSLQSFGVFEWYMYMRSYVYLRMHIWLHMWEICKALRGYNPRINSCFADEDFVRILCGIVA